MVGDLLAEIVVSPDFCTAQLGPLLRPTLLATRVARRQINHAPGGPPTAPPRPHCARPSVGGNSSIRGQIGAGKGDLTTSALLCSALLWAASFPEKVGPIWGQTSGRETGWLAGPVTLVRRLVCACARCALVLAVRILHCRRAARERAASVRAFSIAREPVSLACALSLWSGKCAGNQAGPIGLDLEDVSINCARVLTGCLASKGPPLTARRTNWANVTMQ